MATYRYTNNGSASLKVTDRPIYGSKRLGSYTRSFELVGETFSTDIYVNYVQPMNTRLLHYELNDHLGNVTAVVTGRLLPGAGAGSPYQAELLSAQGYEVFGSLMPGRNFSSDSYRFGFNGKENDDEVYGSKGTFQDYGFRMYDTRVARFISVDPIAAQYPWYSPYQFAGNKPIVAVDLDGLEEYVVTDYRDASGALYRTELTIVSSYGIDKGIQTVHRRTHQLSSTPGNPGSWSYNGSFTGTTIGASTNAFASPNTPPQLAAVLRERATGVDQNGNAIIYTLTSPKNVLVTTTTMLTDGSQATTTGTATAVSKTIEPTMFKADGKWVQGYLDANGNQLGNSNGETIENFVLSGNQAPGAL